MKPPEIQPLFRRLVGRRLRRQRPASKRAVHTVGTASRPVTKLRTIDETAELLNVSPRTVRRLIESGALPAHRLGRIVRIADPDLVVFLAASRSV
jgi:excisionase family DNA binding protein